MTIEFPCPHCNEVVQTPASDAGKRGRCPSCQGIVKIPILPAPPSSVSAPAPSASDAAATIPTLDFPCSRCGKTVQTPSTTAGKKGRCPSCQAIVKIPLLPGQEKPKSKVAPGLPPVSLPAPQAEDEAGSFSSASMLGADSTAGSSIPTIGSPAIPRSIYSPRNELYATGGVERVGLPWEVDGMGLDTLFDTVSMVIYKPIKAFTQMKVVGGKYVGYSLVFYIGSSAAAMFAYAISWIIYVLVIAQTVTGGMDQEMVQKFVLLSVEFLAMMVGFGAGSACWMGLCMGLGFHFSMLMLKANRYGFMATMGVVNYTSGSCIYYNFIPLIGPLLGIRRWFLNIYHGLQTVHGTGDSQTVSVIGLGLAMSLVVSVILFMIIGPLVMGSIWVVAQGLRAI